MAARALLACALACSLGSVGGIMLQRIGAVQHSVIERAGFRAIYFPRLTEQYQVVEANAEEVTGLPANLSIGVLQAYTPVHPATDDLLLWLAGSTQPCSFYSELLETVGASMRVLCLPYDNLEMVGRLCSTSMPCYRKLRKKAVDGNFNHVPGNNIQERFLSAMDFLEKHDGASWGAYVDRSTKGASVPNWGSIRVAGHSQGAGNAAMIGYKHKVARVTQIGGVCDYSLWPEKSPMATPTERWFAFGHAEDHACSYAAFAGVHWRSEGILKQHEEPLALREVAQISGSFLGDAHVLLTFIPPPENCSGIETVDCAHDSTCGNVWGDQANPYPAIWRSLVGL